MKLSPETQVLIGRLLLLTGFAVAVGFAFHNVAAGVATWLGVNVVKLLIEG